MTTSHSPDSIQIDEYDVAWHGHKVAKLSHDGRFWSFHYNSGWIVPLSCAALDPSGAIPSFISNLLPEVIPGDRTTRIDIAQVLSQSDRFLSNVAISKDPQRLAQMKEDRLEGRLRDFTADSVFVGRYSHMPQLDATLLTQMNDLLQRGGIPRMSGCQAKLPCNLSVEGKLSPAGSSAFTHILKLPGLENDASYLRGAVEWASMSLARAGGVPTAEFALIELPRDAAGNSVLAYVTERFDLAKHNEDRLLYCEDFNASLDNSPAHKFSVPLEFMMDTLINCSTSPEADARAFFKLVYANKLLENGDFHAKNAALLREMPPTLDQFTTTRLAPAYDIMNTRYFNFAASKDRPETMALYYQNSNDYDQTHLTKIGKHLGIPKAEAVDLMQGVARGIALEAVRMCYELPAVFDEHPPCLDTVRNLCARAVFFCTKDFPALIEELPGRPVTTKSARP